MSNTHFFFFFVIECNYNRWTLTFYALKIYYDGYITVLCDIHWSILDNDKYLLFIYIILNWTMYDALYIFWNIELCKNFIVLFSRVNIIGVLVVVIG